MRRPSQHEPGNLPPWTGDGTGDLDEVLELGRNVARSIETNAYAGMATQLSPEAARTAARLIRMGVDVEERMAARQAALKAEIIANGLMTLSVDAAVKADRAARAEERGAQVLLWSFCVMWSIVLADAGSELAVALRGLF